MANLKVGLMQMALKGSTAEAPDVLAENMLRAHLELAAEAARQGVQVLCFQELFNQPYFCPSKDDKWFAAAELVPDGPTISAVMAAAAHWGMVIVAPIFERDGDGKFWNTAAVVDADGSYLGKYRKSHIRNVDGGMERYYFRPGDLGYPVFETAFCKLGVYICYDRHFPEGWRALALGGADYIVNPSATHADLSRHLWELEQPAAAVANAVYIGAINRVGVEEPWNWGQFYGSSYVADPTGRIIAQASANRDELLVAELDLDLIQEMRDRWNFYASREPTTYGAVVHS